MATKRSNIIICICSFLFLVFSFSEALAVFAALNLTHQHPNPDVVVQELHRRVNESLSKRQMLPTTSSSLSSCLTGNPIDDCWRCDPDWASPTNRQRLADCPIGFGRGALGGKGGPIYVVTDSSDSDPVNPKPGTLRYGVVQDEPLWIVFSAEMTIQLSYELVVNSYKTIDGRGYSVHITGAGCITLEHVTNVIIHNVHVHDCYPAGEADVRSSATRVGWRTKSDGDGISISGASKIWIDHCSMSNCRDGLIDAIMGSTAITISNNYFSRHNEVMLLGHRDDYVLDNGMQVTIAFNHFGQGLVQRMPRCRRGYIHHVNNDVTYWEIYAIGGSANPTINSQGNRYIAPSNPNAKEVTKRIDTDENKWTGWNWRTEGDIMVNGAFFVPSGDGLGLQYARATSVAPKSSGIIDQLTANAGVFGDPRDDTSVTYKSGGSGSGSSNLGGSGPGGGSDGDGDGDGDVFGMIFGGNGISGSATAQTLSTTSTAFTTTILLMSSIIIIDVIYDYYFKQQPCCCIIIIIINIIIVGTF